MSSSCRLSYPSPSISHCVFHAPTLRARSFTITFWNYLHFLSHSSNIYFIISEQTYVKYRSSGDAIVFLVGNIWILLNLCIYSNPILLNLCIYTNPWFFFLCFQPGNGFGRLPEPLQTVASEYCPGNYSVSQTANNEKLHTGEWNFH